MTQIKSSGGSTSKPPKRTPPATTAPTEPTIKNMQDGRYELHCPVCKISLVPELPCPMDKFIAIVEQFTKDHDHEAETAVSQEAL